MQLREYGAVSCGEKREDYGMSDILSRVRMYVREKGKPAADYLAEKFSKHDIVLLGEDHGIRENLR